MKNKEVRELLAHEAEKRIGKTRFELDYKCEETCAEGATDVLNTVAKTTENSGLNVGSVSCNTMYANMSQSPDWYEPSGWMERGDYIFFDWNLVEEDRPLDHVGIVLSVNENEVTYANINGSSHNTWTIQTIRKNSCNIAYWLRYLSATPETTSPDQTQTKDDIKQVIEKLQALRDDITAKIDMYIRSLNNIK